MSRAVLFSVAICRQTRSRTGLLHQIRLGGRGQNAHAQGLGEDQRVPGRRRVFQDRLGVHKAGYGQSVNGSAPWIVCPPVMMAPAS